MTGEADEEKENGREDSGSGKKPQPPSIGRQLLVWMIVIAATMIVLMIFRRRAEPRVEEKDVIALERHLKAGNVKSLHIKDWTVTARLEPDVAEYEKIRTTVSPGFRDERLQEWKGFLPDDVPDALVFEEESIWPMILANALPILILLLILIFFFRRQMQAAAGQAGQMPFSKSKAPIHQSERPEVTFRDVAGVKEAKEELQETVEFLRNPEKFRGLGGRTPRGLLMVGHPGTGKTLLSKAVAGEADVPFFTVSGSDFVEMFVGVGASRARDLFKQAKENQPCIIFLDEIDAVGRKRGAGLGGGHDEREQTLNAILGEMDGFERHDGVIVIAATNRPDVLDPALLRPGRFDRRIVVDLPDIEGREAILKIHARRIRLAEGTDLGVIARGTPGFSGADLEAVINEGALIAGRRDKEEVGIEDLEEARDKVRFGREKKSRAMSDDDRHRTAYHEAGHAFIALENPDVEPLHKVSIIPRGVALGMTMILPEEEKYGLSRRECFGTLELQMAGRVSEELFREDISSGAKDDIENATKLARRMVTEWGMSEKIGAVSYSQEEEHVFLGNEISRPKKHGEEIARKIDEEVHRFIQDAYQNAKARIEKHSEQVRAIAEALLKLEDLDDKEVKALVNGKSVRELVEGKETRHKESNG